MKVTTQEAIDLLLARIEALEVEVEQLKEAERQRIADARAAMDRSPRWIDRHRGFASDMFPTRRR